MSLRITIVDEQTGDTAEQEVDDGDFLVICVDPCEMAHVQTYPKSGKAQITIRGWAPPPKESR